jgi:hypothetical protein
MCVPRRTAAELRLSCPQASDVGERLGDALTAIMAVFASDESGTEPAKRTPIFTHDDLLTCAITRSESVTVVKAYLDLFIAVSA